MGEVEASREKQRARWRRNKRAERLRKRPAGHRPLSPDLIERIWVERDQRLANYPLFLWNHPNWHWGRGSNAFQCDVWAVRTLLEWELGIKKISDGKIARWMVEHDLTHGYRPASLRTMVWRAREAIAILETAEGRVKGSPCWPPF